MHQLALVLIPEGTDDVETAVDDIMSTYQEDNGPGGFWDYYQIGGGWDHLIDGNVCPVRKLPEMRPFALITPWTELRRMYWVGDPDDGHLEEDAHWDQVVGGALIAHRDMVAVVVDYHA